jgi:hypothetical protein
MDSERKRQEDSEECIEHCTLIDEEKDILENKTRATLPGCASSAQYCADEDVSPRRNRRFPRGRLDPKSPASCHLFDRFSPLCEHSVPG